MKTAVAMLVFNRPELTRRVFDQVRLAKPEKLLIVADGPRAARNGEDELCRRTRDVLTTAVDWKCEVLTNCAAQNMGCRERVSSGLNWVFSQVDEAIILEDDCLPDPTFFPYCEELLARYRDDTRIMGISGCNFGCRPPRNQDSYYFSRYMHVWGWASWSRAWRHYDVKAQLWPELRDGGWLEDVLGDRRAVSYWSRIYQDLYDGLIDTWDYQWQLTVWYHGGLVALPNRNLISNIGFSAGATHTTQNSPLANLPTAALELPVRHPRWIIRNSAADTATQNEVYNPGLLRRIERRLQRSLSVF
jgi:hypothetical protein